VKVRVNEVVTNQRDAETLQLRKRILERCNPWPHVANCHTSGQLLSSGRRYHYDVICAYGARKPAILIMTSFATELATPSVMDYERTDALPRLIYLYMNG